MHFIWCIAFFCTTDSTAGTNQYGWLPITLSGFHKHVSLHFAHQ